MEIPEWIEEESSPKQVSLPEYAPIKDPLPSKLQIIRHAYEEALGQRGMLAQKLSKRRKVVKTQQYSFSLISAVSHDAVLANQLIEGGVDSSVFENFVFRLLDYVRKEERYEGRHIVLLMDNATIHKHPMVVDTIIRMKCILLYNP